MQRGVNIAICSYGGNNQHNNKGNNSIQYLSQQTEVSNSTTR